MLGRWLRRAIGDERRAEAYFILVLSGLIVGVILFQYVAWAWLGATILADPTGSVAVAFWLMQLGSVVGSVLLAVVGFQPAIRIVATPAGIQLQQGKTVIALHPEDITSVETISALTFHRHYRRYAATRSFVNRIEDELLLLHTSDGPLVLGLSAADHARLLPHLKTPPRPVFAEEPAHAA